MLRFALCLFLLLPAVSTVNGQDESKLSQAAARLRAVEAQGVGHREARQAWQTISRLDAAQLTAVLAEMRGAGPLAENWFRSAVETIAARARDQGQPLPRQELEQFILNRQQSPRGRRLAYELLVQADPSARQRLVGQFLNDPSDELRRDAVADALAAAGKLTGRQQQIRAYRTALDAARDPDQVAAAEKALKELGQQVDLARHFGFLQRWHLIAPFDNSNKRGFDVAWPPEAEINLEASYPGKGSEVRWVQYTGNDPMGIIDLNKVIGKVKGAIAYAYTEFQADRERDVELRLGCINGNKVWLNGRLLTANHVYHANMQVDQYVGRGRLRKGKNTILVMIAQNEQDEQWAQRWQFQLRVCDQYGTAVLSLDRPGGQQARRAAPTAEIVAE